MRRPGVVFAVVAALVTTAAVPALAHSGKEMPGLQLTWRDCHTEQTPARLQCATVTVPLDWSRPDGATIDLALNRLPALDAGRRIGSLLVNPGGPGGSGVQIVQWGGLGLATPEFDPLLRRFDVVGFDPRGVGASAPIVCPNPLRDASVSTLPTSPEAYRRLEEANRAAGTSCAQRTGELIGHVDARSVARDIEAIRIALRENVISWLGVSYGTELGATYAAMYPHRIRAMVLDSAVDHSLSTRQAAVQESAAIEDAFDRFATWCHSDADCSMHGEDIPTFLDTLTATADAGGLRDTSGAVVTAAQLTEGVYVHLQLRELWPTLAQALAKATGHQPDVSDLLMSAAEDDSYAAYVTVGCHDFPGEVTGFADLNDRMRQLREVAPHMWRHSEFWTWTTSCLGWPIPAANPPNADRVEGASAILVVGTIHDPATPYAWAQNLTTRIAGSRLLTYDGDGHAALYNSACVRSEEAAYLTDLQLPETGNVCQN